MRQRVGHGVKSPHFSPSATTLNALCSDFKRQNAAIARFDVPAPDAADRRTVAQLFVERQVAAMRGDLSQKQAYSVAQQWMMENGKELFERLNVPDHVKEAIVSTAGQRCGNAQRSVTHCPPQRLLNQPA